MHFHDIFRISRIDPKIGQTTRRHLITRRRIGDSGGRFSVLLLAPVPGHTSRQKPDHPPWTLLGAATCFPFVSVLFGFVSCFFGAPVPRHASRPKLSRSRLLLPTGSFLFLVFSFCCFQISKLRILKLSNFKFHLSSFQVFKFQEHRHFKNTESNNWVAHLPQVS